MIKLIMFDLDGTLVDSIADITNSLNHAIAPYGIDGLTEQQAVAMVGEGLTRLIEQAVGAARAAIVPEVLERFVEHYGRHLTDLTRPYPGVAETLAGLNGYEMAVISNKREAPSREILARFGLLRHFRYVLGSDSVEEKKPSPRPLQAIMGKSGLQPREAVMVGDSTFDIQAGRAAGVTTVAVSYGYRDKDSLKDADYIIDRMDELPAVLDRINLIVA